MRRIADWFKREIADLKREAKLYPEIIGYGGGMLAIMAIVPICMFCDWMGWI